jgi:2-polyprenyl-6-methoxyphenol hydroxylase-like FAD-dependent oxidoreductase
VCLIGDAAHAVGPHVGQGAALALEDAFVLAKCLRDLFDPPEAFTTFERLRRRRAERVIAVSRRIGGRKTPAGPLASMVQNLVLPFLLRRSARATEWMYDYRLDWDERIPSRAA